MQSLRKFIIYTSLSILTIFGQDSGALDDLPVQSEELNLVTVHAEDAHLPSILAILAKESGYNIVTDPNVNRQE